MENDHSENEVKIIYHVQTWQLDVKNLKWSCHLKTANKKAEKWCTCYLSSWQEFDENFLDSKHLFKSSRKNKDFVFLPVPILPVWVKIGHLNWLDVETVLSSS